MSEQELPDDFLVEKEPIDFDMDLGDRHPLRTENEALRTRIEELEKAGDRLHEKTEKFSHFNQVASARIHWRKVREGEGE